MQSERLNNKTEQLKALANKPLFGLKSYSGYEVNGFKFHTKERASSRLVQNCGVLTTADTTCFSSARDRNPQSSNVDYFGVVQEIIELPYLNSNHVVLFKCDWFDVVNRRNVRHDEFGFTSVKTSSFLQMNEPYILVNQARQVFYATDPMDCEWSLVLDVEPRKQFNMGLHMLAEGVEPHQEIVSHQYSTEMNLNDSEFMHSCPDVENVEVDAINVDDMVDDMDELEDLFG